MSTLRFANPDQALIHRFIDGGARPIPFDANPMARALGAELRAADLQAGRVELAFAPDPLFIQGTGVLQGGAVTAMLDFAMAFATLAHLPVGASCATVNLNTAFLRPAPQGHYLATGEVERRGRQLAFTHARLMRLEDRVVVATATSTLAVMLPEPT
ncbi:PaaI family thioesterase [Ottowia sp. SB7-C50]|uniref:PaaI family thioesterase n=1 Tax=Ottowia sp. SB7-C50 TaxID=3081231 RepID=UPI002954ADC3|nr:PaaI family thioesterase [Ottowia sp. SB7-C50]WOP15157.1 PaaI family thioesterase [Ottowia sp. SB7-C50]